MKDGQLENGDLRVWYIPQVPSNNPFYVFVSSPEMAGKVISLLISFSDHEHQNHIKLSYTDASGLEVYEDGAWSEWYSEDGADIDEFTEDGVEPII